MFPVSTGSITTCATSAKTACERHVPQPVQPLRHGDAQTVSNYALPAMRWACGTGFLQGANGKLNPSGLATRAQLAAMLHRYLTK